MFADSVLETSRAQRTRRSWSTLTSFGLQAVVIVSLLLLPLLRTVGLPSARTVSTPISAGRPDPGPAPRTRTGGAAALAPTSAPAVRFVAPGHIAPTISRTDEGIAPQPAGGCGDCVPGVGVPGAPSGPPNLLFGGNHAVVLPAAPAPNIHMFRPSTLLEGSLIRRVQPVYPPPARSARIQGSVVLFAVISKVGTIDRLRVLSGHPMLVPAAIEAVSQWRYRPYILNSEPIEVETQITVNFILAN
jgi:protein TonB